MPKVVHFHVWSSTNHYYRTACGIEVHRNAKRDWRWSDDITEVNCAACLRAKGVISDDEEVSGELWTPEALVFADPGGESALRAGNRVYPCPTCGRPNMLTAEDVHMHYQCDRCADKAEGRWVPDAEY